MNLIFKRIYIKKEMNVHEPISRFCPSVPQRFLFILAPDSQYHLRRNDVFCTLGPNTLPTHTLQILQEFLWSFSQDQLSKCYTSYLLTKIRYLNLAPGKLHETSVESLILIS